MNLLRKIFLAFLIRGFGAFSSFLITYAVTNLFNPEIAGKFLFSYMLIQFFGVVFTFGCSNLILKISGIHFDSTENKVLNSLIFTMSTLSLLLMIAFVLFSKLFSYQFSFFLVKSDALSIVLPYIMISAYFYCLIQFFSSAFQGKGKVVFSSFLQSVFTQSLLFISICTIWFLKITVSYYELIYLVLTCMFIGFFVCYYLWIENFFPKIIPRLSLDKKTRATISSMYIVVLMGLSVQYSAQFATGKFLSFSEVAYFTAANRLAFLASFTLIAVNLVVAPKFANLYSIGEFKKINSLSLMSGRILLLISSPILLAMFIFPDFLLSFFGDEYRNYYNILRILAIGQLINIMTGSVGFLLNMTGHEEDLRNIVILSGLISFVFSFILTPIIGIEGAAIASSLSLIIQNLLCVYMVKKRLGFNSMNLFRTV